METEVDVSVKVVKVTPSKRAGTSDAARRGISFKIGLLLRDTLKVHGEGANADSAVTSQCCYEQHFMYIYDSALRTVDRFKQVVYSIMHDNMNMDERMAEEAKTSVATAIINTVASTKEISNCCTVEMEVNVSCLVTKKCGRNDEPRGAHGHAELNRRIEEEECSICQEDCSLAKDIVVTTCGHVFDRECIFRWLSGRNRSCPMCRSDLGPLVGRPMRFP